VKQTGLIGAQGKRMRELAPKHEEHWFEIYGEIAVTGQPVRFMNRAEQLHRWYDVYAFRVGDPENRQVAILFNDITDRKQVVEALKESESKYRLLADNVNDVIFVLDMNLNYTYVSPSIEILRGYEPEEVLKSPSIETLTPSSWDLAVRTLSEVMDLEKSEHREINISRTLELEMIRKDETTVWTEVKFSFIRDKDQRPVGILGLTRDITERKRAEEQLQRTIGSLRKAIGSTIQVMVSAVEIRDPYTAGHQLRVAGLASAIATEIGLPQDRIDGIRMAGPIHDIGKLSVPVEILSKPKKLTEIEFSLIKEHSQKGYEMLKDVDSPWPLAQIVYQHHERMDGSGYPRNLKGDEILMEARIMAIADVVESMASHRPYRPALGLNAALEEIEINKGTLYDADVVDACLRLFREKGFQLESIADNQ
jgi:PAS domain S-box-containing protein/putative nucleotidyltransferase with HDIG domain